MAVNVAQFVRFPRNLGKWIKRGKNHYKHGRVESCSQANRVSRFCKSKMFLNTYFESLILKQLFDKLRLSCLAKLAFQLTNIIFKIGGTI